MKKQSDLSRLMGYVGNSRYFTYASWVLSAVSALVPFVYIWKILRDVLNAAPDYAQAGQRVGMSSGRTTTEIENPNLFSIGEGFGFFVLLILRSCRNLRLRQGFRFFEP